MASNTIKKNSTVTYVARASSGSGKVIAVRSTLKGDFYDVKNADGKVISLRLSQLTPS